MLCIIGLLCVEIVDKQSHVLTIIEMTGYDIALFINKAVSHSNRNHFLFCVKANLV